MKAVKKRKNKKQKQKFLLKNSFQKAEGLVEQPWVSWKKDLVTPAKQIMRIVPQQNAEPKYWPFFPVFLCSSWMEITMWQGWVGDKSWKEEYSFNSTSQLKASRLVDQPFVRACINGKSTSVLTFFPRDYMMLSYPRNLDSFSARTTFPHDFEP